MTYYTDLLYFLLRGIIFNLIACSEDHNRIPVQLSTHAQVTEKHDGPKTVLKVSYSRQMFSPAVEKKNSLRFFKYQHLFSVHLNMRLFLRLYMYSSAELFKRRIAPLSNGYVFGKPVSLSTG